MNIEAVIDKLLSEAEFPRGKSASLLTGKEQVVRCKQLHAGDMFFLKNRFGMGWHAWQMQVTQKYSDGSVSAVVADEDGPLPSAPVSKFPGDKLVYVT